MNSQTLFIAYYVFLSGAVLLRLSARPCRQTSERRTGLWPNKIGLRSSKAVSYTHLVRNEKLAYGLRRLTDRQRHAIELAFWEGYQYKEIAVILDCSPAAVTLLLQRAFHRLRSFLAE